MVGFRDFTQSRKLRWWLSERYSLTLYLSSGICWNQSRFEASKCPLSTQTQPSGPIHLAPMRTPECSSAIVIVISFGYLSVIRYFVQVFQIALLGGNSPVPSTSNGPPVLSQSIPQWAMSQW